MIDMLSLPTVIISNDTAGVFPATANVSSHGHKTTTCSNETVSHQQFMNGQHCENCIVFTNIDLCCTVYVHHLILKRA